MYRTVCAGLGLYYTLPLLDHKVKLYYKDTEVNRRRIEESPSLSQAKFFPSPYLCSGILQAYFGSSDSQLIYENTLKIEYDRQFVPTSDGGIISIDWARDSSENFKGVLLIVPGLTGGSEANYIMSLVSAAQNSGLVVGVYNGRGIEGNPLTSLKGNHLGHTEDLELAINTAISRYPGTSIVGIGTSMGGNLILKYAGLKGKDCEFKGIVAVSTPFDIVICSRYLRKNWPRPIFSDWYITENMVNVFKKNFNEIQCYKDLGVDLEHALSATRSYDFDNSLTVKVLGYKHPEHYYREVSCVQDLHNIQVPVFAISSLDDPVVTKDCIPYEEFIHNEHLILGVTRCGGHVDWFSGVLNPKRWYLLPTFEFLDNLLK